MKKIHTVPSETTSQKFIKTFNSSITHAGIKAAMILLIIVTAQTLRAQTLQQVTANGNVTNAGIIMNGPLTLKGYGYSEFQEGNADFASYDYNNFYLRGWWGMGMKSFDGVVKGFYDFRTGSWDVKNSYRLDGSAGIFIGNGDNASFSANNMYVQSWYGIGFKSTFDNTNRIYFNTRNGNMATQGSMFPLGNVGIGTESPQARLEVLPPTSIGPTGILHLNGVQAWGHVLTLATDNTGGQDDARLLFSYRNKSKQWAIGGQANINRFSVWEDSGDGIYGSGFGNERLTVIPGGNVGIGTSNPDDKLTVKGRIHAEEVKINMNVLPDYVFNTDYKLLSLTQVEAFVKKNHHLPEVPSAADVSKNGLKVGEMNATLLKKVEELTLYLIEKDKQLKKQQDEISVLKEQRKEIDDLKAQMAKLLK